MVLTSFSDPLDGLKNLIGWQANKSLYATIANCGLTTIEAILNHAEFEDWMVAARHVSGSSASYTSSNDHSSVASSSQIRATERMSKDAQNNWC